MKLGALLRRDREGSGLTVNQTAEVLEITPARYRQLEDGSVLPDWDTYDRICRLFGWPRIDPAHLSSPETTIAEVWSGAYEQIVTSPIPFDEDADVRSYLAALGPFALAELRGVLEDPAYRLRVLRALVARPASRDLATLTAMADTDKIVRLRLLRAIRDLDPSWFRANN